MIVRVGKRAKDRVTMLPAALNNSLCAHLDRLRAWYEEERRPAAGLCRDPYTGLPVRHHPNEKIVQRAVQGAVRKAELTQPASCHTLRHCFAAHLLEDGYTTMIYTHVMAKGARGVRSPLDRQGTSNSSAR